MAQFLEVLRLTNRTRCERWHDPDRKNEWNLADWSNAMVAEAGEMAGKIKKIRRLETNTVSRESEQDREELIQMVADEMADVIIYMDLLADRLAIDLETATREKFNRTSVEFGFPERL